MAEFDSSTPGLIWTRIKHEASTRGWFLLITVWFANLYLYAFGLDAFLSVLDDLRRLVASGRLSALREFISILVLIFSALMGLVLIFVHQLPKRILLAPILFVLWVGLGAIPIWLTPDKIGISFILSLMQLALFSVAIRLAHSRAGKWHLTPASLPYRRHIVLRVLGGFVLSAVILPVMLAGLIVIGFAQMIEHQTDGYMHFSGESVAARETVLTRGNKTVYLIGMVHIADPEFYREVFAGIPADALVLAEGVTDRKGLMKDKLSYGNAASMLGLAQQPDILSALNDAPQSATGKQAIGKQATGEALTERVLRADLDLSDFSEATMIFLHEVGHLYASTSLSDLLERLAGFEKSLKPEDMKLVTGDILDKRNAKIISVFREQIVRRDALVIAWGAIHMPVIEKEVRDEGFTIQSKKSIPAIRYSSLWQGFKRGLDTLL